MLFSNASPYSELAQVSSSTFNDVLPFLILVAGILFGFFIIERLIGIFTDSRSGLEYTEKPNYSMEGHDTKGYHSIFGKSGQVIGWEKDN